MHTEKKQPRFVNNNNNIADRDTSNIDIFQEVDVITRLRKSIKPQM